MHKDVLSQADILAAMKLTSSQDRDAVGGWIEGQADRAEGRRILADLPKLSRGEGYLWAPADDVLARVAFPHIRTYDSPRTPKRGERIATPRTLAEVDLSAITAALAEARAAGPDENVAVGGSRRAPAQPGTGDAACDRWPLEQRRRAAANNGLVEVSGKRLRVSELFR